MAQTYLDIQNAILLNAFDSATYRNSAKQAILDALGDIARQMRLPANETTTTITTVGGTASYALPGTNVRLIDVEDTTNNSGLDEMDLDTFDDLPPSNGTPEVYSLYANNIQFWPTPNSPITITARYLRTMGLPASDGDVMATVTGLPEESLGMLVSFGRHRLFRYEDDAQMSAFWLSEYERELRRYKGAIQRRNLARVRRVPGPYRVR
jgi:hypothetical protein